MKKGKRILILAGTYFQVPVIEYAKQNGHYVITCDDKPDNPGHKLADEYINVSTTDLEGVLEAASLKKIDGILAYGSDPAAPAAAYVSEMLNLPGNSFKSVLTLSDKGLFRQFLADNNFPVPDFRVCSSAGEVKIFAELRNNAVFIKPVNSSGSKGITRLLPGDDPETAFRYAEEYSRTGKVIVEEEIKRKGPHIHGEAFVFNGELKFMLLGDQYFSQTNICAPLSTTLPSLEHAGEMKLISDKLVALLQLTGFRTGGLNIEIIRDNEGRIYFVEIGARNGGNLMPALAGLASGIDLPAANVNASLNEPIDFRHIFSDGSFCTQVILHSPENGKFRSINIPDELMTDLKTELMYYKTGEYVHRYRGSQDVVGVLLFAFRSRQKCNDLIRFITHNNVINLE